MSELSERAQMMLGAYAMADTHTLDEEAVVAMSGGAIDPDTVRAGLGELVEAGLAEAQPDVGCRLTKAGIALSLKMQEALKQRMD